MPTSAPGNRGLSLRRAAARAFTLIELLVVLLVVAIAAGTISLALRDGAGAKLEEEGARLASLLESARAESRAAGTVVRWMPQRNEDGAAVSSEVGFRFVGLPADVKLPAHWLEPRVTAQVVGAPTVLLGPDAILPPQRVLLRLDDRRVEVASDGLAPFAVNLAPVGP